MSKLNLTTYKWWELILRCSICIGSIPSTVSKLELIKIFINLSSEKSPFYDNDKIIIENIKSFEITPLDNYSVDSLTIDGEYFKFNNPLKGNIINKKINIY